MKVLDEITLAINQTANTEECGSCYFFKRNDSKSELDQSGLCNLQFPPNRIFIRNIDDGEGQPLNTVNDTDSCSFWKTSGNTFIVSKRLKP